MLKEMLADEAVSLMDMPGAAIDHEPSFMEMMAAETNSQDDSISLPSLQINLDPGSEVKLDLDVSTSIRVQLDPMSSDSGKFLEYIVNYLMEFIDQRAILESLLKG